MEPNPSNLLSVKAVTASSYSANFKPEFILTDTPEDTLNRFVLLQYKNHAASNHTYLYEYALSGHSRVRDCSNPARSCMKMDSREVSR